MDTSETYIKMCDCPVIQLKRKIKLGDYMALRKTDITAVCVHQGLLCRMDGMNIQDPEHEWIKLLRQDQIQEMMIKDYDNAYTLLEYFSIFWSTRLYAYWVDMTPEQAWLAFYMHEKHSKVWADGEKWVKE